MGTYFYKKNIKTTFAVIICCCVMLCSKQAVSQCAVAAEGAIATNAQTLAIETAIEGAEDAVKGLFDSTNISNKLFIRTELGRLQTAYTNSIKKLNTMIIEDGLKPLTAQLVSSKLLANVQNAKAQDSKNMQRYELKRQDKHYESIQEYKPSPQDYKFDSKGIYLKIGDKSRRTMSTILSKLFSDIGNNAEGYNTNKGRSSLLAKRWITYQKFCDPTSNRGNLGCENTEADNVNKLNLHIMPSKTIFTNYTMDFENEEYLMEGLKELAFNITGFTNNTSIITDALGGVSGSEKLLNSRTYLAQMDAVNSMIYSIIAERFPTPEDENAPDENPVKQVRDALGMTEPSNRPSFYESRQSFIEELRSPEYYLDLIDQPNTIDRKEIYLRAYGLVLLNEMIDKQEKVSNAYAIETANMLQEDSILTEQAISSSSISSGR